STGPGFRATARPTTPAHSKPRRRRSCSGTRTRPGRRRRPCGPRYQYRCWHPCWYNGRMAQPERKITIHVPEDLLVRAQKSSGQGITETVRQGLRLVAAGDPFRRLAALRGSVKFSLDLRRLREDRG